MVNNLLLVRQTHRGLRMPSCLTIPRTEPTICSEASPGRMRKLSHGSTSTSGPSLVSPGCQVVTVKYSRR